MGARREKAALLRIDNNAGSHGGQSRAAALQELTTTQPELIFEAR
jgi:hypothetical protein